jgi:hypothetical protein
MSDQKAIEVGELIAHMLDHLASVAWVKLGLQPDPFTGEMAKDIDQARVAVDAVAALVPVIEGSLDEDDRRELHNLLRNLRINFMEKSKE